MPAACSYQASKILKNSEGKKEKKKTTNPVVLNFSLSKVFYCWIYGTFPAAVSDGCRYE